MGWMVLLLRERQRCRLNSCLVNDSVVRWRVLLLRGGRRGGLISSVVTWTTALWVEGSCCYVKDSAAGWRVLLLRERRLVRVEQFFGWTDLLLRERQRCGLNSSVVTWRTALWVEQFCCYVKDGVVGWTVLLLRERQRCEPAEQFNSFAVWTTA